MTASSISRCLPLEIIEKILAEAWSQFASTNERWDLYKTLSAAHPSMHELFVTVAARHPCFMFNASRRDILLYRETTDRAASFARARGGTASNGPASPPAEHIRIDITLLAFSDDIGGLWRRRWEEYVSDLQAVVPECSSITLLSRRLHDAQAAVCLPVRSLSPSFPFIKRLYINYVLPSLSVDPLMPIPSVLFLRIKKYPACKCGHLRHRQPHYSDCLTPRRLLHTFPNLQQLHLEQPSFLKLLDSPHSLHTITLEAPPTQRISGRAPFSSLLEYNIPAALRRGFLQWPRREHAVASPTIVVHTGLAEPLGFEQAQLACTQYDVALRREIVYME